MNQKSKCSYPAVKNGQLGLSAHLAIYSDWMMEVPMAVSCLSDRFTSQCVSMGNRGWQTSGVQSSSGLGLCGLAVESAAVPNNSG